MKMTCCIVKEFMDQHHDAAVAVTTEFISFVMQISMNVRLMSPTTVMKMHSALTQWGVTSAPATLATLEMVSTVQVSCSTIIFNLIHQECNYNATIQ